VINGAHPGAHERRRDHAVRRHRRRPAGPRRGFAYEAARRFGLPVIEPEPALVPLTLGAAALDLAKPLSGVAFDCTAACGGARFREAALFTHRGLSGPAILQVSSYWRAGDAVTLDLTPGLDAAAALVEAKQARPKVEPQTMLAGLLPARLAKALAADALPARPVGEIADKALRTLGERLNRWTVEPTGTEGFAKAEVTLEKRQQDQDERDDRDRAGDRPGQEDRSGRPRQQQRLAQRRLGDRAEHDGQHGRRHG
jgi:hypothetical protein